MVPLRSDSTGQAPGRRRGGPSGSRRGRRGPPPVGGKSSHPGSSFLHFSRVTNARSVAYTSARQMRAYACSVSGQVVLPPSFGGLLYALPE
jgi:hypothetical protein